MTVSDRGTPKPGLGATVLGGAYWPELDEQTAEDPMLMERSEFEGAEDDFLSFCLR